MTIGDIRISHRNKNGKSYLIAKHPELRDAKGAMLPKNVPSTIQTEGAAKTWFINWLQERNAPKKPDVVTIRSLSNWWFQHLDSRMNAGELPKTQVDEWKSKLPLHILTHAVADVDLTKLSYLYLEPWLRWLKTRRSDKTGDVIAPFTIRNIIRTARTLVDDAVRMEKVNILNPFRREILKPALPKFRKLHRDNEFLEPENMTAVLTSPSTAYWRKVRYLVCVATGLRDGEVNALLWSDIKMHKSGRLYLVVDESFECKHGDLKEPKLGSFRDIPLHPEAAKALLWWKTGWKKFVGKEPNDSSPIFPDQQTGMVGAWARLPAEFRLDLAMAGQPTKFYNGKNFTIQSLRHTFATWLELADVNKTRRDQLMGHRGEGVGETNYLGKHVPTLGIEVDKLPIPVIAWA